MKGGWLGMAAAMAVATCGRADGGADFVRICTEDFNGSIAGRWVYDGATNAAGEPLFRHDASAGNVTCQWDQALDFASGDPCRIVASRLSRPLGLTLTDRDTFRVGATLCLAPGSVPDTTEFFQIANFGLYNTNTMGPDRAMGDPKVKDCSDLVEFNYFINNDGAYGPSIGALVAAHTDGLDGDYLFGSSVEPEFAHSTIMGPDHWLPEGTNLYVEVAYFGGANDGRGRRAYCGVYTDPARTHLVNVNGVAMYYWTPPLPTGKTFTVNDVAFQNYPGANWGGANGTGRGTWDDTYVDVDAFPHQLKTLVKENFDSGAGGWQYQGVTNKDGAALFRHNAVSGNVDAEWDESNRFDGSGDPYVIEPSRFSHALGKTLDDRDTFRVRATLRIAPGSVPNTTEGYQIANLGLYNTATMGADRCLADDWSGNAVQVKDGSDFVDLGYFINNAYGGPSLTCVIGAHIEGVDCDYTTGASADVGLFHNTLLGLDHWLPEGTNLYIEVVYFGGTTNGLARRAYAAVYADAERTALLSVNGILLYYWTQPLPGDKTFTVTDVAFCNYVNRIDPDWGGANGAGQGTWDDVSVEVLPARIVGAVASAGGMAIRWTSVPGRTYRVLSSTNLAGDAWETNAVVTASGYEACFTNSTSGGQACYSVAF